MLGRGGFSFKNEALDLAFQADSKKFSLFSGQSPVVVNGHFAEPHLDVISGELLARAGGGRGLTAISTPLAGISSFVHVGSAQAAAFWPALTGPSPATCRTAQ